MNINLSNIQAIIFDLDGVILDSMSSHTAAWSTAFDEFDLQVEKDFILRHEGALDRDLLKRLFALNRQQVKPELFDKIYSRQREIYSRQYAVDVSVFPEAARLVNRLGQNGIRRALVTSSRREVLSPNLWNWLTDSFSPLVTGDQVNRFKPHPEPYMKALDELGLQPQEALVVENAPAGIASAKAAGISCIALTTTLPAKELFDADVVLEDHAALSMFFKREGVIEPELAGTASA
ncbi:MAG: HAD family phosphatase [Deltaproteobacteria bacterium]|nr:HAD family phosphatase [Deltaproteobacteria bacterium]MBW2053136.1 HAD family phosphatase [Deltaproteobacteria bacterium]MBW2142305.1 HAD family phosphatase [Deltaproteobacteria bacterium]MBW2324310.1 HAD family phosphatase [Deltaproteobacteria bacterium]